jgi:hypothetical protein
MNPNDMKNNGASIFDEEAELREETRRVEGRKGRE